VSIERLFRFDDRLRVNGLSLHYLCWTAERKNRTAFVLLHGLTGNAHVWNSLSPKLAEHGLCAPSACSAPLRFAVPRLSICCGIRQHIYELDTKALALTLFR
jgi:hypothetical protein